MCTYMTAIEAEKELQAARELDGFTGKLEKSYISRMVKDAKRNSMIGDKIQIVVNPIYIHIPKWQRKMNKVRAYNIGHNYNKYKWDVPKVLLYNDQLWVIDGQYRIFGAFKGGKDAVPGVFDNVKIPVKSLQDPNENGRQENDRKGSLQEILCLFPKQLPYILSSRKAIVRKLHHKRHRLSFKFCYF